MRKQFIQCETREEAEALAPWASVIEEVCDGFMAFESWSDHEIWCNQQ